MTSLAHCRRTIRLTSVSKLRLILASFALSSQQLFTDAAQYSKLCPLRSSPSVTLHYNFSIGSFSILNQKENVNGLNYSNRLLQRDKHISNDNLRVLRGVSWQRRTETNQTIPEVYLARLCPCDPTATLYCLLDGTISDAIPDTCGIRVATDSSAVSVFDNNTIDCFKHDSETIFIHNVWPIILLWYGALFIFFGATENGKHARLFLLKALCPNVRVNDSTEQRILRENTLLRLQLHADAVRAAFGHRSSQHSIPMNGIRPEILHFLRQRVTHRWMENTEASREASSRDVFYVSTNPLQAQQPQMEYVIKVKKFDAKREQLRRQKLTLKSYPEDSQVVECTLTTHLKKDPSINEVERASSASEIKAMSESDINQSLSLELKDVFETSTSAFPDMSQIHAENNQSVDKIEQRCFKLLHNIDHLDKVDDYSVDCAICLTEVSDGELVGVLRCSHIFHVNCLTEWLKRRNECPLCKTYEIATPRPVSYDL